ncbi:hypothetical protein NQ318_001070 [Aromia moschata]|uniref:Uncharacterized protein n=1 Tax=Aromia moschata TaxID=1265417 RepID=A0AAV8ZFG0_9CUCU|nr:hypothetical protein NQ318_001070 [Aromia moschata]
MNVYPAHKFLNGLDGLKRDVKRPKTIRALDGPQRQKRTKTLESTKNVFARFCMNRSICAKMVPKLLIPEQKESRINICADILNNIDTDPGLLDTVITCDESVEAVKAKAAEVLNQLTEAAFQHCFQQWKCRMERYMRAREEDEDDYIICEKEGENESEDDGNSDSEDE